MRFRRIGSGNSSDGPGKISQTWRPLPPDIFKEVKARAQKELEESLPEGERKTYNATLALAEGAPFGQIIEYAKFRALGPQPLSRARAICFDEQRLEVVQLERFADHVIHAQFECAPDHFW